MESFIKDQLMEAYQEAVTEKYDFAMISHMADHVPLWYRQGFDKLFIP